MDAQTTQPSNRGRRRGEEEKEKQEGGAQEEGEIQPREMIINEAIHPLRSDSETAQRRRNSLGRDDKVRRIEDDVKNKRSVFTTV